MYERFEKVFLTYGLYVWLFPYFSILLSYGHTIPRILDGVIDACPLHNQRKSDPYVSSILSF